MLKSHLPRKGLLPCCAKAVKQAVAIATPITIFFMSAVYYRKRARIHDVGGAARTALSNDKSRVILGDRQRTSPRPLYRRRSRPSRRLPKPATGRQFVVVRRTTFPLDRQRGSRPRTGILHSSGRNGPQRANRSWCHRGRPSTIAAPRNPQCSLLNWARSSGQFIPRLWSQ